jgi:hypothetical protein
MGILLKSVYYNEYQSGNGIIKSHSKLKARYRFFKNALFFLFIIILLLSISNVAQAGMAIVRLEMEQGVKEAEVGPGKSGAVSYDGDVKIDRFPTTQQTVNVWLYADAGGEGWSASISPSIIAITPLQQRANFTLHVVAPQRESINVIKEITITGRWQTQFPAMYMGEVEPNVVTVRVKRFFLFIIIPAKDLVRVLPSQTAEFDLLIINQGNSQESFSININDYQNLVSAGYSVDIPVNTVTIDEGGEGHIKFKVRGPQNDFHIWKMHQTPIPVRIVTIDSPVDETVTRPWTCMYYEVGPFLPDPCIFGIIFLIIIVITLVWARKKKKLFWKRKRRKRS